MLVNEEICVSQVPCSDFGNELCRLLGMDLSVLVELYTVGLCIPSDTRSVLK
jgi:hypothetical protein